MKRWKECKNLYFFVIEGDDVFTTYCNFCLVDQIALFEALEKDLGWCLEEIQQDDDNRSTIITFKRNGMSFDMFARKMSKLFSDNIVIKALESQEMKEESI